VGLAFRQDKLYLLSMSENVNAECNNARMQYLQMIARKGKELIPHRNYGTVV
jgi:hypothetical protein